jgi:proteasome accessory factor B/proteasome accessory factor C
VPKEERLLNLLAALSGTDRGMSKADIRRLVNGYSDHADDAFERMFERDKESLRELGVPLATIVSQVHETDVAYRVTDDSASTTELSLTGVWREASLRSPAQRGLTKLLGVVDTSAEAAAGPATPQLDLAQPGPAFATILDALTHGKSVRFTYRAASTGEVSDRVVDPWSVAARGRAWYLIGHDHARLAPRVFHLGRIRGNVRRVDAGPVTLRPADLDVDAELSASASADVEGTIALAPGRGGLLRGEPAEAPAGAPALPDGWRVVRATASSLESLAASVTSVGDGAVALDPPELVAAVRRRLTHLARLPECEDLPAPRQQRRRNSGRSEVAEDRIARLLALVLHLHEHGDRTVKDLADHFGVSEKQILSDVDLLWVTGLPGYSHSELIDFSVDALESGVIALSNDQGLARPLTLTTSEAVLFLVALGPLRTVADALGLSTEIIDSVTETLGAVAAEASHVAGAVDVAVPQADPVALTTAREAIESGRRMHIRYVSAADVLTERDVDPRSLVPDSDAWLLSGWCLRADAPRTFRVDRILDARVLDTPAEPHPWPEATEQLGDVGEEVVLDLAPTARRFAESIPHIAIKDLDDGSARVWLRVADPGWFLTALLQLGDDALALGPTGWVERVRVAADGALAAYDAG